MPAAIASGRFGVLSLADVYIKWHRSQEYYDNGGWKGTQVLDGGGALMNQAIHVVDLLLWMMGPVDSDPRLVVARERRQAALKARHTPALTAPAAAAAAARAGAVSG